MDSDLREEEQTRIMGLFGSVQLVKEAEMGKTKIKG